jgi:hypothetical protein
VRGAASGGKGGRRPPVDRFTFFETEWITATDARKSGFLARTKEIGGEMRRLTGVFAVVSSRCVGNNGSHVKD